ncbi:MAG TPA: M20 family metallopeptidase [Acidimicrobiales bacterium]|nr:M20 family metallopeptidase [Acidimicrobiales bacterium]
MSAADIASAAVRDARASLIALSHFVHAHPELGYEEYESSEAVAAAAEAAGFTVERGIGGLSTAFRAVKGSGDLHVVYCAEYDALPDVGHACGHNIIAASSLGAAIGLAAVADELNLTVTLLGTPSEEGGGGKIDLIKTGFFDDAHVAMMVHPWPTERLEATCLAVDHFDVTFSGKDAHASAAPWEGINALDALTISQVALALLRQQLRPGDQFHGIVAEGGSAANIIPSRVVGRFMARSTTSERLGELRERMNACFEAGSLATGASVVIEELGSAFSHMESDLDVLAHYRAAAESLGRTFELDDEGAPKPTISTDMANVSLVIPSIHPLLGIPTNGAVNHQPEFTEACVTAAADQAVIDGAIALALTAVSIANDEGLRARLMVRP